MSKTQKRQETSDLIPRPKRNPGTAPEYISEPGVVQEFIRVSFLDPICAPILKRVNRVLLALVQRVSAYNAKRGR